jgi:polar amino acid transport system substrate-binding protein
VGSLTKERLYFWGLKTKFPQPIDDIDQFKDYKVAASRYSNVAQYLIDHSFYNIYQPIKEEQNMLMLYRNRVDLIIATERSLKNRAEKLSLNFDELQQMVEVPELNNDLCIAFSLNTAPDIVARFKQGFNEIKQQGIIEEIKQKWRIEE